MIIEFVVAFSLLIAVWVASIRWSLAYLDRHGRRPPRGWLFARADDSALERSRRILLVFLGLAALIALSIFARASAT